MSKEPLVRAGPVGGRISQGVSSVVERTASNVTNQPLVRVGRFGKALILASAVKFEKTKNDMIPLKATTQATETPTGILPAPRCGEAPQSRTRPSANTKKRRRESENAIAPGGLRSPWRYVVSNPRSRQVGIKIAAAIDAFVSERPHIIEQLIDEGAAGRKKIADSDEEEILVNTMAHILGTDDTKRGPRSKWRAGLVGAYVQAAQDPDHLLAGWLRNGSPAGVALDIEACGVFPHVENQAEAHTELHKFYARAGGRKNYKSAEENAELVMAELERLEKEEYVRDYGRWEDVKKRFGEVIVSRLAAIIKNREDGSTKVRLIVDMLRSRVNRFVKLHERIVLPRLMDIVTDVIDLILAAPTDTMTEDEIDMMCLDFQDAFHTMGVAPEELPYQVFRRPGCDTYAGYDTVVFGGGGAGLVWGRGGALLGRSGQSLFTQTEARIQIYVDDPWTIWRGTKQRIRAMKTRLLLWWLVLGPEISWSKVQHGDLVKWIGCNIQVNARRSVVLILPQEYAMELMVEAKSCMKLTSIPVTRVQSIAGKSSWVAGFIPAVGSMISPFWAAIADCKAKGSSQPSATLVPTVRICHALRWIVAFCSGVRGTLKREFMAEKHKKWGTLTMEFDASPWGFGGVLFRCGKPWSYFAEPISQLDIDRFGIKIGSSSFQALLETMAVLIGVRVWLPLWQDERLAIRVRSDSAAALGAMRRERSNNADLNEVVRELALDLAEGLYLIDIKEHLAGKDNTWADPLSRLYQPGAKAEVPAELRAIGRQAIPLRDAAWWRSSGDPLAEESFGDS